VLRQLDERHALTHLPLKHLLPSAVLLALITWNINTFAVIKFGTVFNFV